MQEQLLINKVEINSVKERIMQLSNEIKRIENKIPQIEGDGDMVTEAYAMAECFG